MLFAMCAGYFLVLLDVTIVNVALPSIGAGLHAGVGGLQWVVDGYAVALASLMLAGGTFGDLHGHKRIVLAGMAVFGAASVGCGAAPSTAALVGFRAVQGAGAALMLPGTLAVITHAYRDTAARSRAIGVWAAIGSIALPAGPLLGGALTEAVGWRAIFLLNVPVVAAAFVLAARTVRETCEPERPGLDLAGVALGATLLATLTFALIQTGRSGVRPGVVAPAAVAVLAGCALIVVERRASHPMLPVAFFRRPGFAVANSVAGTMNLVTLGLLFLVTLYLQAVRGRSALDAGLALLPLFAPLSLIAPFSGRLTARAGPRLPMIAGLLLAAGGLALLALAGRHSGYGELAPALLLWGGGLGVLTPAVVSAAIAAVPAPRAGLASAVNNTARQAGGAVGIAALGALAGASGGRGLVGGRFVAGLHLAALIGAGLFVAAALITLASRQ